MRSIRYRRGTKKYKHRNRRSLNWFIQNYGTSGIAIYQRQ